MDIDLSELRDLHTLVKPDFWPLAIGWWIIIGCVFVILTAGLSFFFYWRQTPMVYSLRKVHKLAQTSTTDLGYLKEVSKLLRRVAIALYDRPRISPLSDQKWQDFLWTAAPDTLTRDEAHLIAFAPYEQAKNLTVDRLLMTQHLTLWIKKVFKNKKSS